MARSLNAPLNPHEEVTLRHIAHGVKGRRDLAKRDLDRLKHLALISDVRGQPELTVLGRARYSALPRTMPALDVQRDPAIVALEEGMRRARARH